MKLTPLAWFLILSWPGPGAATGTSSYVSTSAPPVLCTRTAATIAVTPCLDWHAPRTGPAAAMSLSGAGGSRPSAARRTPPPALCHDVDCLDRAGERHCEIDISARNMEPEAVGDQCDPDQHKEGERQHLRGGVFGDERADRRGRRVHHDHGDEHRSDHYLEVLHHPDRRDD